MKTLSIALIVASTFALFACGDDTGGGSSSGSGGAGGAGGDGDGDTTSPSSSGSTTPTTTASSGNVGSSGVGTTGPGGVGVGGGGGEFICEDGSPIPAEYACDLEPDCLDGSDEAPINPDCPTFTCADGVEIPADYECDLFWDCEDLSDEFPTNGNCEDPGLPEGWACMPAFYEAGDGCDCGCGVVDPDCADETAESCEYCVEPSCASDGTEEGTCDLEALDPTDNSQCL